jgi:hypothetical protein
MGSSRGAIGLGQRGLVEKIGSRGENNELTPTLKPFFPSPGRATILLDQENLISQYYKTLKGTLVLKARRCLCPQAPYTPRGPTAEADPSDRLLPS